MCAFVSHLLLGLVGGSVGPRSDFTGVDNNPAWRVLLPLPEYVQKFVQSVGFFIFLEYAVNPVKASLAYSLSLKIYWLYEGCTSWYA